MVDNWLLHELGKQDTWKGIFLLPAVPLVFLLGTLLMMSVAGEYLTAKDHA